jgi:hypothetical protein
MGPAPLSLVRSCMLSQSVRVRQYPSITYIRFMIYSSEFKV